jgi:hypothetical protein
MRSSLYFLLALPLLVSCAPHRPEDHRGHNGNDHGDKCDEHHGGHHGSTRCQPSPTQTSTTPPTSTSCIPTTTATKAYTVIASHSGSPIHLLSMEAGGLGFRLGGGTASYCPTVVTTCPPGNQTVFLGGSISVEVPGGQQQYLEPGGRIGYTQAHSAYMPLGSIPGGFNYYKCPNEQYGHITTTVFGATGLMACPDTSSGTQQYVVFASIPNAVVPSGNVQDCIGFSALTSDYDGSLPAAWQYV